MNTRHCVYFASQGSVDPNSLGILRLSNNESMHSSTYYQLVICIAVIYWFVLGHQPSDCYTRKGRAAQWGARHSFGECAAVGVYYEQLQANVAPLSVENGKPQIVEVGVKAKKELDVRSAAANRHRVIFLISSITDANFLLHYQNG